MSNPAAIDGWQKLSKPPRPLLVHSPGKYLQQSEANETHALYTCPLMFNGPDMCLSELPVMRQLLPLTGFEVFGREPPHDRADVLCLQAVVLLERQVLGDPGVGVTVQSILQKCHSLLRCHRFGAWFVNAAFVPSEHHSQRGMERGLPSVLLLLCDLPIYAGRISGKNFRAEMATLAFNLDHYTQQPKARCQRALWADW